MTGTEAVPANGAVDDLNSVNRPGGPFVSVRNAGIAGREVELRRLVDAVRRIVAVTPALDAQPGLLDDSVLNDLKGLVDRIGVFVPSDEDRLARVLPPVAGDLEPGDPGLQGSVRVGNPYGMASGLYSPISPATLDVEDGRITGYATFGDLHCEGGEVHSGIIAACFDVVLAMANRIHGMFGPTMELSCTRLRPTVIGVPCRFEADVDWFRERVVVSSGRLVQDGVVTVESSGAFRRFDQVGIEAVGLLRGVARGDVP